MAAPLSDVLPGSFFQTTSFDVPTQKYLRTKDTGTDVTKVVVYNLVQSVITEMPADTMVVELDLVVGTQPVFTI